LPDYYKLEDGIMRAVAERFGLEYPIPPEVKHIDERLLATEKEQIMNSDFDWPGLPEPIPHLRIALWPPIMAERKFLDRFYELTAQCSREAA
jgi:hypothetical protein